MKKVISVLLAVLMVFSVSGAALAALETDDLTKYPVIIVPGYSSSSLHYEAEDGSTDGVWGLDMDEVFSLIFASIAKIGVGIGMVGIGKAEHIAKTVGEGAQELLEKMKCNPDGTSKYNIKLNRETAQETNSAALREEFGDNSYQHETEIMGEVAGYIGEEQIFNFTCDFRMGAVQNAARLDSYIQDVLEYSGAEKVNIIAVSHGGQVSATYLTLYGYKKQVDNAVLTVPAIGGAGLAYDILNRDIKLDEENLIRFIEHGMMAETDYNWLVKAQQLGFLDDICNALVPYFYEIIGNWGSIWDFIPADYYEQLKNDNLDSTENAELIRKSDYMHYSVMPKIGEGLQKCISDYGMNVSIMCGTGNNIVTGLAENSDAIITTNSSSGATVAPFGMRFADGYTAINGDNAYVSPAMDIDASTAYLPDNTWFIDGLFHGMTYKDDYTIALMMKLMLTDDITSVYTNPDFPRFHATTNRSSSVYAEFNESIPGHVSANDTELVIKNISVKYPMKVLAITCDGMDIKADLKSLGSIAAGESKSVAIESTLPELSKSCTSLTVTYVLVGSLTPVNERTLYFTVDNGEAPEYDAENPYVKTGTHSVEAKIGSDLTEALDGFGLIQLVSIIYNIFMYLINTFKLF